MDSAVSIVAPSADVSILQKRLSETRTALEYVQQLVAYHEQEADSLATNLVASQQEVTFLSLQVNESQQQLAALSGHWQGRPDLAQAKIVHDLQSDLEKSTKQVLGVSEQCRALERELAKLGAKAAAQVAAAMREAERAALEAGQARMLATARGRQLEQLQADLGVAQNLNASASTSSHSAVEDLRAQLAASTAAATEAQGRVSALSQELEEQKTMSRWLEERLEKSGYEIADLKLHNEWLEGCVADAEGAAGIAGGSAARAEVKQMRTALEGERSVAAHERAERARLQREVEQLQRKLTAASEHTPAASQHKHGIVMPPLQPQDQHNDRDQRHAHLSMESFSLRSSVQQVDQAVQCNCIEADRVPSLMEGNSSPGGSCSSRTSDPGTVNSPEGGGSRKTEHWAKRVAELLRSISQLETSLNEQQIARQMSEAQVKSLMHQLDATQEELARARSQCPEQAADSVATGASEEVDLGRLLGCCANSDGEGETEVEETLEDTARSPFSGTTAKDAQEELNHLRDVNQRLLEAQKQSQDLSRQVSMQHVEQAVAHAERAAQQRAEEALSRCAAGWSMRVSCLEDEISRLTQALALAEKEAREAQVSYATRTAEMKALQGALEKAEAKATEQLSEVTRLSQELHKQAVYFEEQISQVREEAEAEVAAALMESATGSAGHMERCLLDFKAKLETETTKKISTYEQQIASLKTEAVQVAKDYETRIEQMKEQCKLEVEKKVSSYEQRLLLLETELRETASGYEAKLIQQEELLDKEAAEKLAQSEKQVLALQEQALETLRKLESEREAMRQRLESEVTNRTKAFEEQVVALQAEALGSAQLYECQIKELQKCLDESKVEASEQLEALRVQSVEAEERVLKLEQELDKLRSLPNCLSAVATLTKGSKVSSIDGKSIEGVTMLDQSFARVSHDSPTNGVAAETGDEPEANLQTLLFGGCASEDGADMPGEREREVPDSEDKIAALLLLPYETGDVNSHRCGVAYEATEGTVLDHEPCGCGALSSHDQEVMNGLKSEVRDLHAQLISAKEQCQALRERIRDLESELAHARQQISDHEHARFQLTGTQADSDKEAGLSTGVKTLEEVDAIWKLRVEELELALKDAQEEVAKLMNRGLAWHVHDVAVQVSDGSNEILEAQNPSFTLHTAPTPSASNSVGAFAAPKASADAAYSGDQQLWQLAEHDEPLTSDSFLSRDQDRHGKGSSAATGTRSQDGSLDSRVDLLKHQDCNGQVGTAVLNATTVQHPIPSSIGHPLGREEDLHHFRTSRDGSTRVPPSVYRASHTESTDLQNGASAGTDSTSSQNVRAYGMDHMPPNEVMQQQQHGRKVSAPEILHHRSAYLHNQPIGAALSSSMDHYELEKIATLVTRANRVTSLVPSKTESTEYLSFASRGTDLQLGMAVSSQDLSVEADGFRHIDEKHLTANLAEPASSGLKSNVLSTHAYPHQKIDRAEYLPVRAHAASEVEPERSNTAVNQGRSSETGRLRSTAERFSVISDRFSGPVDPSAARVTSTSNHFPSADLSGNRVRNISNHFYTADPSSSRVRNTSDQFSSADPSRSQVRNTGDQFSTADPSSSRVSNTGNQFFTANKTDLLNRQSSTKQNLPVPSTCITDHLVREHRASQQGQSKRTTTASDLLPSTSTGTALMSDYVTDVLGAMSLARLHKERSKAQEEQAKNHVLSAAYLEKQAYSRRYDRLRASAEEHQEQREPPLPRSPRGTRRMVGLADLSLDAQRIIQQPYGARK